MSMTYFQLHSLAMTEGPTLLDRLVFMFLLGLKNVSSYLRIDLLEVWELLVCGDL